MIIILLTTDINDNANDNTGNRRMNNDNANSITIINHRAGAHLGPTIIATKMTKTRTSSQSFEEHKQPTENNSKSCSKSRSKCIIATFSSQYRRL